MNESDTTAHHDANNHWWSQWYPYKTRMIWRSCQFPGCTAKEIKDVQ